MRRFFCLACLFCGLLWAAQPNKVRIVAFDKLQGRIASSQKGLGLQDLKDFVSLDYHEPLIISLGDNYQGSFDSHQDKGEKVARLLKELGAGYTLLSDLDLCLGIKQYQKNNTLSGITTLATNLQSQKLKELSKFPQHTFVVKNGFKILFLGGYNQDFFVNQDVQNSSLAAAIKKEIEKIFSSKTQESPNAIILLLKMPDGFDSFSKKIKKKELEEVCQIKGISAIFISDDQHSSYLTRVKGTPIISTSLKDNQISQLDLEFKPKFKFLTLAQAKIVTIKPATFAKSSVYQGTPLATCQTTLENKPTDKSLRHTFGQYDLSHPF